MDIQKVLDNLERKGFKPYFVENEEEANRLILSLIPIDDVVGTGGSATLNEIKIGESLMERGTKVLMRRLHPDIDPNIVMKDAVFADWFMSSTNALTEDGQFVNTDGNCNRISSHLFGGKNTVFVLGVNKIVKNLDEAFERIRTVAAPKNCIRFGYNNPCVTGGDCNDCDINTSICHATSIITLPPRSKTVYVVIINKSLGY